MGDEFTTDNLRVSAVQRYSFGVTDYRAMIGTPGDKWWDAEWYELYELALAAEKSRQRHGT